MFRIILLMLATLISLTSCRTKKVVVAEQQSVQQSEITRKLDSIVSLSVSLYQRIQTHSLLEKTRFELHTEKDENGITQPLEYTHEVDGKVKEKITLSGGTLIRSIDTKNQLDSQTISEEKDENNSIKSDGKKTEKQEVENYTKNKEIESKGLGFGWYVSFGIIAIILGLLAFLKWRLKLF